MQPRPLDALLARLSVLGDCDLAVVFGSVARGSAGPGSDVDILVASPQPPTPRQRTRFAQSNRILQPALHVFHVRSADLLRRLRDADLQMLSIVRGGVVLLDRLGARRLASRDPVPSAPQLLPFVTRIAAELYQAGAAMPLQRGLLLFHSLLQALVALCGIFPREPADGLAQQVMAEYAGKAPAALLGEVEAVASLYKSRTGQKSDPADADLLRIRPCLDRLLALCRAELRAKGLPCHPPTTSTR